MPSFSNQFEHRRRLLQWLSASPLLASPGFALSGVDRPSKLPELEAAAAMIAKPEEAINVFDFEPVFFKNVPPAHIGYMASDRKSTRLNSSHGYISYAVFCLKKKKKQERRLDDIVAHSSI